MKYFNCIVILFVLSGSAVFGQKSDKKIKLHLTNAVVVGQVDNPSDRYSIEINMTELLTSMGVKAVPSLNLMKQGSDTQLLASDSVMALVKAKGVDTYLLVGIRGYDRKFKLAESQNDLKDALERGSLYELYQPDIVSITFEFKFYRDGKFVYADMIKCGNIGSRDSVIKKLRTRVSERAQQKWLK